MLHEPAATRVVLIGASNMTRGFAAFSELASAVWGARMELLAAVGVGRSYGNTTRVLGRTLPSVLDCGLWRALDAEAPGPTVAFVGDIGNDLLYGRDVPTVIAWVDECVRRLRERGARIVMTTLPPTAAGLTRTRFFLFRKLLFPSSPLRYEAVHDSVAALDSGVRAVARAHGASLVELRREWYGLDPIHIRIRQCRAAWTEIVATAAPVTPCPPLGVLRSLRPYVMTPEWQAFLGVEMRRRAPYRLSGGATLRFY
jgi:hypothetical protein